MENLIQKYKSTLDLLTSFLSSIEISPDPSNFLSTFALITAKMESLIKEIETFNYFIHPNTCPIEDPDICNYIRSNFKYLECFYELNSSPILNLSYNQSLVKSILMDLI